MTLASPFPALQVTPQFKPAGFWLRLVAVIIDGMILNIITFPLMIIYYIVYFGALFASQDSNNPVILMLPSLLMLFVIYPLMILVGFLYHGWFYKNKGATLGKMIFKMKVVNCSTGENLSYGKTFLREFVGKLVCTLTLMIGYIIAGFRDDKQGLHDMIANTQVLQQIN